MIIQYVIREIIDTILYDILASTVPIHESVLTDSHKSADSDEDDKDESTFFTTPIPSLPIYFMYS